MGSLNKISLFIIILAVFFSSCVSYSNLQTPETLEPGHVSFGVGTAVMVDNLLNNTTPGILPELSGRIGISKGYDLGFKYVYPGIYMADLKHELQSTKVNTAFDLGVSVTNVSITDFDRDIFTIGFYPMFLIGKDFWYAGARGTISLSDLDSSDDQLSLFPFITGGSIITGLKIGNERIKLILELNTNIAGSMALSVLPACGLYVGF